MLNEYSNVVETGEWTLIPTKDGLRIIFEGGHRDVDLTVSLPVLERLIERIRSHA